MRRRRGLRRSARGRPHRRPARTLRGDRGRGRRRAGHDRRGVSGPLPLRAAGGDGDPGGGAALCRAIPHAARAHRAFHRPSSGLLHRGRCPGVQPAALGASPRARHTDGAVREPAGMGLARGAGEAHRARRRSHAGVVSLRGGVLPKSSGPGPLRRPPAGR